MKDKNPTKRTFKTKAEKALYEKRVANMAKARAARLKQMKEQKAVEPKARKIAPSKPLTALLSHYNDSSEVIMAVHNLVEVVRKDERERIRARFEELS